MRRVSENPAELIAPSEGAPQEVSTSRSAGARSASVRFVRSSTRGAREGECDGHEYQTKRDPEGKKLLEQEKAPPARINKNSASTQIQIQKAKLQKERPKAKGRVRHLV